MKKAILRQRRDSDYICHSDTTRCKAYDQTGKEYIPLYPWGIWENWKIQRGEIYAVEDNDFDDFPQSGKVALIPTKGVEKSRLLRSLTPLRVEISAMTFRRCFEKARDY